jgi:hypothetical protein
LRKRFHLAYDLSTDFESRKSPSQRHGGRIENALRHSLTARFLNTKKFIHVLSRIAIDSFFAKAIAFEVLRICLKKSAGSFPQETVSKEAPAAELTEDAPIAAATSKKLYDFYGCCLAAVNYHGLNFSRGDFSDQATRQ